MTMRVLPEWRQVYSSKMKSKSKARMLKKKSRTRTATAARELLGGGSGSGSGSSGGTALIATAAVSIERHSSIASTEVEEVCLSVNTLSFQLSKINRDLHALILDSV